MKLYLFIQFLAGHAMAQLLEYYYTSFQEWDDAQGWIVSNNYQSNLFTICNGVTLFGGQDTFGMNAIVSKLFNLPPHYQLQITFELWIIDSWNNEYVYVNIDDESYSNEYYNCYGACQKQDWHSFNCKEKTEEIQIVMNHNSESLMFIMTSNLNEQANNESWGFRDFSILILRCPQGCLYCQDNDYNNCYYWIGFLSLWHQSIQVDGWMKNNNIQPKTYKCVSFDLIGLAPNDKLEKIIENLTPHYKMQVQLQIWKIDSWNNEIFFLEVDDQIYNQTILGSTGIYNICGSNGLEKIINIAITLNHSQSQCKITMRTNHNPITTNAQWGVRAFNIYLAKCFKGCDQCLGPLKTECTVCSSGWVFYNNLCTHTPPMLYSQIQITQIKDPNSKERIPMEINLLEVDQKIITQGNITLSVKINQQILTIQVYTKCFQNKIIKSQFLSNKLQDLYQYQFQQNCQGAFNSIIYNVKYKLRVITEQELIINTSDTYCLIYQIVQVADEIFRVKILEILLEDV